MRPDGPQQRAPDFPAGFLHAAPFAVVATSAAFFCGPVKLEAAHRRRKRQPRGAFGPRDLTPGLSSRKNWRPPHQQRTMTTKRFTEVQIIPVVRASLAIEGDISAHRIAPRRKNWASMRARRRVGPRPPASPCPRFRSDPQYTLEWTLTSVSLFRMCCCEELTRWARSPYISTNDCLAKPRSVDQNAGQEERESQSNQ